MGILDIVMIAGVIFLLILLFAFISDWREQRRKDKLQNFISSEDRKVMKKWKEWEDEMNK